MNLENFFTAYEVGENFVPPPVFGSRTVLTEKENERIMKPLKNDKSITNGLRERFKNQVEDSTPPNAKAIQRAYLPTNEASIFPANLGLIAVLAGIILFKLFKNRSYNKNDNNTI